MGGGCSSWLPCRERGPSCNSFPRRSCAAAASFPASRSTHQSPLPCLRGARNHGICPQESTWPSPTRPPGKQPSSSDPPGEWQQNMFAGHFITLLPHRSLSCPDLSRSTRRVGPTGSVQPARQINMMLLNPRAPKIRHLNASHSLLIEMEKHVRKVQVGRQTFGPWI